MFPAENHFYETIDLYSIYKGLYNLEFTYSIGKLRFRYGSRPQSLLEGRTNISIVRKAPESYRGKRNKEDKKHPPKIFVEAPLFHVLDIG